MGLPPASALPHQATRDQAQFMGFFTSSLQSTRRIDQDGSRSQRQKYARYPVIPFGFLVNTAHGQQSPVKKIIIEHMDRYSAWAPRTASIHVLGDSLLHALPLSPISFGEDRMAMLVSGREMTDGSAGALRVRHTVSNVGAYGKACSAVDRAWHVRICRLTLLADAG